MDGLMESVRVSLLLYMTSSYLHDADDFLRITSRGCVDIDCAHLQTNEAGCSESLPAEY